MENASKALILAAEVLIGVIIISMAVFLFLSFNSSTVHMEKQMEESQLTTFNNQYLTYEDKNNLTIYDVITVANMAEENNKYYEVYNEGPKDYNFYVEVELRLGNNSWQIKRNIEKNKINYNDIRSTYTLYSGEKNGELMNFKCKAYINDKTGRVNKVIFYKV